MNAEPRFGEWLADRYDDAGMKQFEFAGAVGVEQPTVSSWVAGETYPTRKNQKAIAAVLNEPFETINEWVKREKRERAAKRGDTSLSKRVATLEQRIQNEIADAYNIPREAIPATSPAAPWSGKRAQLWAKLNAAVPDDDPLWDEIEEILEEAVNKRDRKG